MITPIAGRSCPASYRTGADSVRSASETAASCAWIAGGLYGNLPALLALRAALAADQQAGLDPIAVFNGDFHWFDRDPALHELIQREALKHHATAGNVEAELAQPSADAGCGCAYPPDVPDDFVERSNLIHASLRAATAGNDQLRAKLASLPRALRLKIGDARVGVVHGDPDMLAGWQLSHEARSSNRSATAAKLQEWAAAAAIDAFACTHTCLPWAEELGGIAVINNGAAGMPNFAGELFGLATRITLPGHPHPDAIARIPVAGAILEAIPLRYDQEAWLALFDALWPAGTPAAVSYRARLTDGPQHSRQDAYGAAQIAP